MHNTCHFIPDVYERFCPVHFIGQRTDIFSGIGDIIRTVYYAALFIFEIIMDGMFVHGEFGFLSLGYSHFPDMLFIFFRSGIDENRIRLTHGDCIGDFNNHFGMFYFLYPRQIDWVQFIFKKLACCFKSCDASYFSCDVYPLLFL